MRGKRVIDGVLSRRVAGGVKGGERRAKFEVGHGGTCPSRALGEKDAVGELVVAWFIGVYSWALIALAGSFGFEFDC
jgi:hypothetical protein